MARPGDIIGGKYRLIHPLGVGGMGAVWRAEHVHLKQAVAIKLMDVRGPAADRSVKRFLREGQIAASIRHRNVVYISDFGTDNGQPYLVMELLEGVPLSERLCVGEPMTVAAFLNVMLGALEGLATVHDAGIVHRDIKPENIFLVHEAEGEYAKVLDFGLSRAAERGRGHTITREGIVLGTPEYVSPEQARGAKKHDPRSDLYSMGVVMYEALAGRRPIEADNAADLIVALLNTDPVPLDVLRPDLPKVLCEVVMQALRRDPEQRHRSAREMRQALLGVIAQLGEAASLRLVKQESQPHYSGPETSVPPPWELEEPYQPALPGQPREEVTSTLQLAIERLRAPRVLAGAAAGVFVVGVILTYLGLASDDAQVSASDAAQALQATPLRAPEPQAQVAPAPPQDAAPPPAQVRVSLEGLPDDAQVWLDGEPAVGPTLELLKGDEEHEIKVTAPGRRSWSVTHSAVRDGEYRVRMPRRRASRRRAPTARRERAPRPRRSSGAPTKKKPAQAPKDIVRQLDF